MIESKDIEFLISTMNRNDLGFLNKMFPHHDLSDLNILIINQTTEDAILKSEDDNIRVVNAFEKGLSKSRNLALQHTQTEVALIADDDVEYLPDVLDTVITAYNDFPEATLISFQYLRENRKTFKIYKTKSSYQNQLLHKQALTSFEMTLRPKLLRKNNISFNPCFGLGAHFVSGEENVLRDDIVRQKLKIAYVAKPIVVHNGKTSVAPEGSKNYTQALTAQKYLHHHNLIYIWLLRYIWLLLKRQSITLSEIPKIWTYGVKAVRDYKRFCK